MSKPSYLKLHETGGLRRRAKDAGELLESCCLCRNGCGVDRERGERGVCGAGRQARVSNAGPHRGEEPMLSGDRGSGTIFFSGCTLSCVYCQNYQISQGDEGEEHAPEQLANQMVLLQRQGCHNVNFVSPTHFLPQILEALPIAVEKGLRIPLVYNTNSYDDVRALQLLDGVFDIYLPDVKYSNDAVAERLSGCAGYVEASRLAIAEMVRQVGAPRTDGRGIARRGVIVRHLVLPGRLAGSREALQFLASVDTEIQLSLMAQYHPCYRARDYPEINRHITRSEYEEVVAIAGELEFENVYAQDMSSPRHYLPDFEKDKPFE